MSETGRLIAAVLDLGAGGGAVVDELASLGYDFEGVAQSRGEFVATARKTLANGVQSHVAQALGRTKIDAARALVKAITRP